MKKLVHKSTDKDLAKIKEDSLLKNGYRTQFISRYTRILDPLYGDYWKVEFLVFALSGDHAGK